MVIDTSAVMAIFLGEPASDRLSRAIRAAPERWMSAPSVLEAGIVVESRFQGAGEEKLNRLLRHLEIGVVPFTEQHSVIAREAFRRFGKGRHPAGLNFGDCFSYALARALGNPLLFLGDDFTRTDIEFAAY
jgi:ribonuclease VapC